MNIMLVSVTERTREIGIRVATGARRSDILVQFIVEAVAVTGVGGLVGLGVGFGIGLLISLTLPEVRVAFTLTPMVTAFACAASIGLIFGLVPARNAAALDPVAALSDD
jgi:macrolide transport system ATP-binding/permease protein